MNRYKLGVTLVALSLVLAIGCGKKEEAVETETPTPADAPSSTEAPAEAPAQSLTVTLTGAPEDTDFTGTVTVHAEGTGVHLVADVSGVDKDGLHGIHVHENGMCDHAGADGKHFSTAGGHLNPTGTEHACPPTDPRHAGDLGNIQVTGGTGHLELTATNLTIDQLQG
ncbi:MAG TPA: superoxide dismutase family protein, partial [Thermoanaerobaculia bacterium]|nr:superoxide dismutase family protein [Thermoanaerobaculia bacterium]